MGYYAIDQSTAQALLNNNNAGVDLSANANQGGMSLSAQGLAFIQVHEGFIGHPYDDGPHHTGNATIGYGHLIHHGVVTAADIANYGTITRTQGLVCIPLHTLPAFRCKVYQCSGGNLTKYSA